MCHSCMKVTHHFCVDLLHFIIRNVTFVYARYVTFVCMCLIIKDFFFSSIQKALVRSFP